MPITLMLNIKRGVNANALHMDVFHEQYVCGGQGEGHATALLNTSIQPSHSNHSWLAKCTDKKKSWSGTACQEDGYADSLKVWVHILHIYMQRDAFQDEFLKNIMRVQTANWYFLFSSWGSKSGVQHHNEMNLLTLLSKLKHNVENELQFN